MMALVMGLGLTSCMDDDWKAPSGDTPAYGNNTLQEKNVVSIAFILEHNVFLEKKSMASQRT